MTTALDHRWTWRKETMLRDCWGRMPVSEIAQLMPPHTEEALSVRATSVMRLPSPIRWPNVYTSGQLRELLGLGCDKAVKSLWDRAERPLPHALVFEGNKPIPVSYRRQVVAWLSDPLNWFGLQLAKIADRRLAELVAGVQARWGDAWLTTGEAANLIFYSQQGIWKLCNVGRLTGHRHGNWWFLRSDVLRLKESL